MDKETRDYIKRAKRGRENVMCHAYRYHLLKEAGVCTTCARHYQDYLTLCADCHAKKVIYQKWYYRNVTKRKPK